MRFEEVLPALREGKAIQRASQPIQWAYVKRSPNGAFHAYGYGDDPERAVPWSVNATEIDASDWVIVDEADARARKPAATHICGRRGVFVATDAPMDHWYERDGRRTCSYCGSAHQDDVMARAEAGTIEFGPTDKSYKAYLSEPPTAEDAARAKEGAKKYGIGKFILEDKGEGAFDEWWAKEAGSSIHGKDLGKFYFQHLTGAQQQRFVELMNQGKLKIGYPGHFYTTPFFIRMVPHEPAQP